MKRLHFTRSALALLLTFVLILGLAPVSAFAAWGRDFKPEVPLGDEVMETESSGEAEPERPAAADEAPAAPAEKPDRDAPVAAELMDTGGKSYLEDIRIGTGSSGEGKPVSITSFDPATHSYTHEIAANRPSSTIYVVATLSDNAPEGSTITLSYPKTNSGTQTNTATSGVSRSCSNCLPTNSLKSVTLTFTVGTDEDNTTYTVDIKRPPMLKGLTVAASSGKTSGTFSNSADQSTIYLPKNTDLILTPSLYGNSKVSINGGEATSSTAKVTVTPSWKEKSGADEAEVAVKVIDSEDDTRQKTYTLKLVEQPTIAVTTPPKKTEYLYNEALDLTDMVVTATYSDNTTVDVTKEYTTSPAEGALLTETDSAVSISYHGATCEQSIKVTVPTTGTCGAEGNEANVIWRFDKDTGALTFTGTGAMVDYAMYANQGTLNTASGWYPWRSQIKSVSIGEGITNVGNYAFFAMFTGQDPVSVTLASSVATVGAGAFRGCSALKSIDISHVTSMGEQAFSQCGLTAITIPSGLSEIPTDAFSNCTSLTVVDIPGTVKRIGVRAFNACTGLETVTFHEGLESIGASAFASRGDTPMKFSPLQLPNGLRSIEGGAFYNNNKLTGTLVIPDSVTDILSVSTGGTNGGAFESCPGLTRVVIGKGITNLDYSAWDAANPGSYHASPPFASCNGLREAVIPASVTQMRIPFNKDNVKVIYYGGNKEQWDQLYAKTVADSNGHAGLMGDPANEAGAYTVLYGYTGMDQTQPVIEAQPVDTTVYQHGTGQVSVVMAEPDVDTSYIFHWYEASGTTAADGTWVNTEVVSFEPDAEGIQASSTLPVSSADTGSKHYYCVISTYKDGVLSAQVTSSVATVTIQKGGNTFTGTGTQNDPYLISSIADLELLYTYVNNGVFMEGKYLKLTADIDMSTKTDWKPIGALKMGITNPAFGVNVLPFMGTLDGDGHTITFASGSKPLFGYVREATIKNLKIRAPYMDGYALVDNYIVDYGTDGSSGTGIPATANIDNVTILSGSIIKNGGLIGGGGSGTNEVHLTNCLVEKNVKIGCDAQGNSLDQDGIGSLVGGINGSIQDCVSYADVYGKNYVGGLLAYKSQSMGPCGVKNSAFLGTVTATGQYVGGIVGSGYDGWGTAPNTPCVSIQNCYVAGNITGANYVGGIFGGEIGSLQCWGNGVGAIQNNHFYGTVTATDSNGIKGGIIGYMPSLNNHNVIHNNHFLAADGLNGIGKVATVDTSNSKYASGSTAPKGLVDGVYYYNTAAPSKDGYKSYTKAITDYLVSIGLYKGNNTKYSPFDGGYVTNRTDDPAGADVEKLTKSATAEEFASPTGVLAALNGSATSDKNWVLESGGGYPTISDEPVAYAIEVTSTDHKSFCYIGEDLDLTGITFAVHWSKGKADTYPTIGTGEDDVKISGFVNTSRQVLTLTASYRSAATTFEYKVLKKPSSMTVYLTVNNKGVVAASKDGQTLMANVPITLGENDNYTMDDVLKKAHAAYCADGYAAGESYGYYSVTKLWGTETYNSLFLINNKKPAVGVNQQWVENGDHVYASVNADAENYADWYTYFDAAEKSVKPGESVALTLKGYQGMSGKYIGATELVKGVQIGTVDTSGFHAITGKTTGDDGSVVLSFDTAGTYYVSANGTVHDNAISKWNSTKQDYDIIAADCPIMAPVCKVTVSSSGSSSGSGSDSNTIRVSFTLLGDSLHEDVSKGGTVHTLKKNNLKTWISKKTYTVDMNATVEDVFNLALKEAGLAYQGNANNQFGSTYISGIQIPGTAGTDEDTDFLKEFDNGPNSGWMYTLNGVHPEIGISNQFLEKNDNIVFHYSDDYTQEQGSEQYNPGTSSSTTTPAAPTETPIENTEENVVEVKPEVTADKSGTATADLSEKDMDTALKEAAKSEDTAAIVIQPEVKGEADKVAVEIPMTSVGKVAETDLDVTVKTDVADITISNEGLTELAKEEGKTLSVSAEAVKDENGQTTGQVKIEVAVGDKTIDKVAGGLNVTLPAAEDAGNVLVIVDADGNETVVKKSIVDGDNASAILDGSCTVKIVDNTKEFEDIQEAAWAEDAVQFAASHELFKGTSDTTFSPKMNMNRAMLATVLYRLEDAAATGKNVFADVKEDVWYTDAVVWASDAGIVKGNGVGFDPDRDISRQEIVVMIYRYAESIGMDVSAKGDTSKFVDKDGVAGWAAEAMTWAIGTGIINGKTTTALAPSDSATRAEVATIMQRLVKAMVK